MGAWRGEGTGTEDIIPHKEGEYCDTCERIPSDSKEGL